MGAVSPLGWGDDFWNGLIEGRSGIVNLPSWADAYPARIAGLVPDEFNPKDWMNPKEVKRQARFTHFAMAAAKMAVEDAKLDLTKIDRSRAGCMIGSGIGGVEIFEKNCEEFSAKGGGAAGLKVVSPFLIPALIANTAAGTVAIELGTSHPPTHPPTHPPSSISPPTHPPQPHSTSFESQN